MPLTSYLICAVLKTSRLSEFYSFYFKAPSSQTCVLLSVPSLFRLMYVQFFRIHLVRVGGSVSVLTLNLS